jgi:glycosyltransferase involved in cell wall biosynthesis
VDVHVALPDARGAAVAEWERSGAHLHIVPLALPVQAPWKLGEACRRARSLVKQIGPDLIHSHFVTTTLLMRHALGKKHLIPRVFQVPGPLHMEHMLCRAVDLSSSGSQDYWIGSSRYILERYRRAGIPDSRLFLSYYGMRTGAIAIARSGMRQQFGLGEDQFVVGNINIIYPPKYFVGQRIGLKSHETVIDALGLVIRERRDVQGLLIGGPWSGGKAYFDRLRQRALRVGRGRIQMPGHIRHDLVCKVWPDFDCAVHAPISENCGGVVEPSLAAVPVVATATGGIPEVIIHGFTGHIVETRDPRALADAILNVLDHQDEHRLRAAVGQRLVRHMFDVRRTAGEIQQIYAYILGASQERLVEFDAFRFAASSPTQVATEMVDTVS